MDRLAPHLARVRLAAEAALLRRLNAGVGFADARAPAQIYLRDPAAQRRLGRATLKPSDTHRAQAAEVAAALAAAETALGDHASPLTLLAQRFGLGADELAVVEVAAAYALDADVRELCHALAARRRPALWADVAAELTGRATLTTALYAGGRLRAAGLIATDGNAVTGALELDAAVLAWLLGDERLPEPLASVARVTDGDETWLPEAVIAAIDALVPLVQREPAAVLIAGPRGSGRRAAAARLARGLGAPLLVAPIDDLAAIADGARGLHRVLASALTAATLRGALPYLPGVDALWSDERRAADPAVLRLLREHPGALALATGGRGGTSLALGRPVHVVRIPRVDLDDRERAWSAALERAGAALPGVAAELAARYVIGPGAVAEVVTEASALAAARGAVLAGPALEEAVSQRLSVRLGAFGQVVARKARFEEMVLPDDVVETLRDMIAMVRQRAQILERWGYQRHLGLSRGVSALFSGEPGTGKTMAASVVASELGLELVRIDLASVVSKYVGETEKNLARIFDEAQDSHAMLLFDEADALFGKRTEVKSANDRYANLEVNYLLQRMETFDGISVLTTNLEGSIDPALQRRLSFRIRFPEPEVDERELLWRRLLPPDAEIDGEIDFPRLAERYEMTGGYIKNAIVRAAVIAARDHRRMTRDDLWAGADNEYAEMGKVMPAARPSLRPADRDRRG
jgi:hypothetical protein